jgi:hypothetical protein
MIRLLAITGGVVTVSVLVVLAATAITRLLEALAAADYEPDDLDEDTEVRCPLCDAFTLLIDPDAVCFCTTCLATFDQPVAEL